MQIEFTVVYVNWVYIIPLKQKKKRESKRMEEQFPSTKWQKHWKKTLKECSNMTEWTILSYYFSKEKGINDSNTDLSIFL